MGRAKPLPEPECPLLSPTWDYNRLQGLRELIDGLAEAYDEDVRQSEYGVCWADWCLDHGVLLVQLVRAWWLTRTRQQKQELLHEYVVHAQQRLVYYQEQLARNDALELREGPYGQ